MKLFKSWRNQVVTLFLCFLIAILLSYWKDAHSKGIDLYYWDLNLWNAIMKIESNCNDLNYQIGDNHQSFGAFQVSFKTAQRLGFTGTSNDLLKFETNYYYAQLILAYLIFQSKGDIYRALFLYNSKWSALKKFHKSGKKSFRSANYVKKLINIIKRGEQCTILK